MSIASTIYRILDRALCSVGIVIRPNSTTLPSASPSVSSGSGAPSATEPNGSLYLRTDGLPYARRAGAWGHVLDEGVVQQSVIAGGLAGAHTVAGIASGDALVSVWYQVQDSVTPNYSVSDLTSEFIVSGTDTVDNTGGTDTSGGVLLVTWLDLT